MAFYGLGQFLGGATKGYLAGEEERRKEEEAARRKEEFQRQKDEQARLDYVRDVSSQALGRVGQPVEDGSGAVYTEDNAYNDIAAAQARVNPTAALQTKATALGLKKSRREEKNQELGQSILALRRRLTAGDDPVSVFQDAAKLYKNIPDGNIASVAQVNGQPMLVLTNHEAGQTQLFPATADTVSKALDQLYSLSSPSAYSESKKLGLETRKVSAQESAAKASQTTAEAAAKKADTEQKFREGPYSTYLNRLGQAALANAGNRGLVADRWVPLGQDKDGAPVFFNQTNMEVKRSDGKPVQDSSIFQKLSGQKPAIPQALGSTGDIVIGNKVFTKDIKSGKYVDVTPGQSILERFSAARGPQGGAPAAGSTPAPAASGLSLPGGLTSADQLLTPDDQALVNQQMSPAAKFQMRNQLIARRREEARARAALEAEPSSAQEEGRYRSLGVDPGSAYFGR